MGCGLLVVTKSPMQIFRYIPESHSVNLILQEDKLQRLVVEVTYFSTVS